MATEILSIGNTPAESAPFTLAEGESAKVYVTTDSSSPPVGVGYISMWIEREGVGGAWRPAFLFQSPDKLSADIPGPGTFRGRRDPAYMSSGLEREE